MWARVVTLVLGLWLIAAPAVFSYAKHIANNGHIIGPLVVTFSIIALSENTRNVRYMNLPLGAWLLFAPWILAYDHDTAFASEYITGFLIMIFTLIKQQTNDETAGGWASLFLKDPSFKKRSG